MTAQGGVDVLAGVRVGQGAGGAHGVGPGHAVGRQSPNGDAPGGRHGVLIRQRGLRFGCRGLWFGWRRLLVAA